jgi:50S ribosomal protein L16 3-hydroxylase
MISFGTLSAQQFAKSYWQKKPLLVRNALVNPSSLISISDLLALTKLDQCESRLIVRQAKSTKKSTTTQQNWSLNHGPFTSLPNQGAWTVLVQAVDTQNEPINRLMNEFRFAGDALLDDVMISYASNGGGVGPHVDSYDVFLIQLHGKRRWRICKPGKTQPAFEPDLPVKILKTFLPSEEWLLEAGDMLYLPAGWAHDGVAEGECVTASVGFRAPTKKEWLTAFVNDLADDLEDIVTVDGPRLTANPTTTPGMLSSEMLELAKQWSGQFFASSGPYRQPIADKTIEFAGRFFTEPKASTTFKVIQGSASSARVTSRILKTGVGLALGTRALYCLKPKMFFINGESFNLSAQQLKSLAALANEKMLHANDLTRIDPDLLESMVQWYQSGWLTSLEATKP